MAGRGPDGEGLGGGLGERWPPVGVTWSMVWSRRWCSGLVVEQLAGDPGQPVHSLVGRAVERAPNVSSTSGLITSRSHSDRHWSSAVRAPERARPARPARTGDGAVAPTGSPSAARVWAALPRARAGADRAPLRAPRAAGTRRGPFARRSRRVAMARRRRGPDRGTAARRLPWPSGPGRTRGEQSGARWHGVRFGLVDGVQRGLHVIVPHRLQTRPDVGQREVLALEPPDQAQPREVALGVACPATGSSGDGSSPCTT